MIADILWVFPNKSEDRVEGYEIDELMAWHARAISRKQADWSATQTAMMGALAMLVRR